MKALDTLAVRDTEGGCVLAVKVVPGASRDRVTGVLGDCLKITTAAAAERGKANAAVTRTLARALGIDRRRVELIAGATHPRKEFHIAGLSAVELRGMLHEL